MVKFDSSIHAYRIGFTDEYWLQHVVHNPAPKAPKKVKRTNSLGGGGKMDLDGDLGLIKELSEGSKRSNMSL